MNKSLKLMIFLFVISASIVLISNLAATKIFDFCGIPVDGGIVVFPISYIIGDLIMEFYGKKAGDYSVLVSFIINLFASLVFLIVEILPEYPGWGEGDAYAKILGFTPRIVIASLSAYILSGLINNVVFEKIKKKTGEKKLFFRTIGSSIPAKIVDSMVFETVAFLGVLPFSEFLTQAIFAFLAGMMLEILLTPLCYFIVKIGREKKVYYEV